MPIRYFISKNDFNIYTKIRKKRKGLNLIDLCYVGCLELWNNGILENELKTTIPLLHYSRES